MGSSSTVRRYGPRCVAALGVTAYRQAFGQPRAGLGRQADPMGETVVWVLPNPSGLNAHFQIDDLARLFGEVKTFVNGWNE
jgi:TDG/mug DNA glycosylase family protein